MDVRYWIPGDFAALASPLPSDSKALRSESDIFATSARGSCAVAPGRRVAFSASLMGDWLYDVRKIVKCLMFSTSPMLHSTALRVRGGGTDIVLMRPKKGSPASTALLEGIAPSSAKIR